MKTQINTYDSARWYKFTLLLCLSLSMLLISSCEYIYTDLLNKQECDVYVAGTYNNQACYWKNGIRKDLPNGGKSNSAANSIFVYEGDIYVAGSTSESYPNVDACYWKNGKLVNLAVSSYGSIGVGIFIINNNCYVCGRIIDKASYITYGAYWINDIYTSPSLNTIDETTDTSDMKSIFVYNNTIYTCGTVSSSYTGTVWLDGVLRSDLSPTSTFCYSIFVQNDTIYTLAKNSDSQWTCFKNTNIQHALTTANTANSIFVSKKNNVYVAGTSTASSNPAVYWKNGQLTQLSSISGSEANVISVDNNENIYVAGKTTSTTPVYWTNGAIHSLDISDITTISYVYINSIFVSN